MWVPYVTGTTKMSQIGPLFMDLPIILYMFLCWAGQHTTDQPIWSQSPYILIEKLTFYIFIAENNKVSNFH